MISRREFLYCLAIAMGGSAINLKGLSAEEPTFESVVSFRSIGNVTILHTTDTHAQLLPTYYREPDTNIGIGAMKGTPPHLTGMEFLKYYGIRHGSPLAYAFTYLDFQTLAREYGKMGGFSHLATLIKQVRQEREGKVVYVDTGDTLQGSALSLWSRGEDMVEVLNLLKCDAMTGHWEFTYGQQRLMELIKKMKFPFIAHNVHDAIWEDPVFEPYVIKSLKDVSVALIGQAFPYTPIANPKRFIPDWSFGIKEENLQRVVDEVRAKKVDLVILLSHSGFDVDRKIASRVKGIDVILGGHTHDAIPRPFVVGKTLVIGSGCYGKFLARLDLKVRSKRIEDFSFKLIPVFSRVIKPDHEMETLIKRLRTPYLKQLSEVIGETEVLLFRRGNFDGTFDDLICDALMEYYDVDFTLSPGFRWGATILPGKITSEDVYSHTAITYPNTYRGKIKGSQLKEILEDIADNLFNPDPYRQQGGDMVRSRGIHYILYPEQKMGNRIADLRVRGKPVDPDREYTFAGWASMQLQEGPPVYEIVLDYIRKKKRINVEVDRPRVII